MVIAQFTIHILQLYSHLCYCGELKAVTANSYSAMTIRCLSQLVGRRVGCRTSPARSRPAHSKARSNLLGAWKIKSQRTMLSMLCESFLAVASCNRTFAASARHFIFPESMTFCPPPISARHISQMKAVFEGLGTRFIFLRKMTKLCILLNGCGASQTYQNQHLCRWFPPYSIVFLGGTPSRRISFARL